MLTRFFCAGILGVSLVACSAPADSVFENRPGGDADIVTVFGDIAVADRAGVAAETEPLFSSFGMAFDSAMGLSRESLLQLPQREVYADYPAGGAVHLFSGPRLQDVIGLADPGEGDVVVTALDGYQRTLERSRVDRHDVILALSMDGNGLSMGGFGPAILVWPRLDDPSLDGMPDDDWVWGVFAIEILERP